MTSLQEPTRADHWEMMRVAVLKNGDSVALNSKNCSAAYYKSLNLQSKHRRPRTQPIVLNRHDASYHIKHPTGPETVRLTGSPVSGNPITQTYRKSPDPVKPLSVTSDKTEERFATLKQLCNTLAWPNNQPQLSQSLSLQLTFSRNAAEDVTLPRLRVLNQILHDALLENPITADLANSYVKNFNDGTKVNNPTEDQSVPELPLPSFTNKPADPISQ
ncbi:hypothetical protein PHET_08408 [Paragonimus heterotremus]|uniref:Uncharacterized protein n=1 Tax=Paragonimus heterotremus TaxID=100268 RepID=A0A8J4SSA9_9TREM|nr:hypothetical protein PHET_08408 [Paragonimus heterotremus]